MAEVALRFPAQTIRRMKQPVDAHAVLYLAAGSSKQHNESDSCREIQTRRGSVITKASEKAHVTTAVFRAKHEISIFLSKRLAPVGFFPRTSTSAHFISMRPPKPVRRRVACFLRRHKKLDLHSEGQNVPEATEQVCKRKEPTAAAWTSAVRYVVQGVTGMTRRVAHCGGPRAGNSAQ